jgi:hypothetical protein
MSFTTPAGTIRFSRDDNGYWTGTVQRWDARATALSNIPANGTAFGGTDPWAAATVRAVVFEESPNAVRGVLTVTYSNLPTPAGSARPSDTTSDGTSVYSMRESGQEKPIEEHPSYKTIWNWDLWCRIDDDGVYEGPFAGWDTKTDTDMTAAQAEHNRWMKRGDKPESPDGDGFKWGKYSECTKPGIEYYAVSGPQVVEQRWYTSLASAVSFMSGKRRGTRTTPGQTFGVSGGAWLITDGSIVPDGKRWQCEVYYQWADVWDTDLY